MQINVLKRFLSKIDRSGGEDACHPWIGAKPNKYGQFSIDSKLYPAHVIAYEIKNGKIIKTNNKYDTVVRHKCNYRPCCNPKHLILGTQKDNVHDAMKAGNFATSEMNRHAANVRWGNI